MRRSALLGTLLLLGGCSGLGHFFYDTERLPGQNPNATTGVSENLQRSRGVEPSVDPIAPQQGNVWPGPPQPLPTLSDVSHFGGQGNGALLGGSGGALPRGGSMSMGEQDSIHRGAPLEDSGFSGGAGTGAGTGAGSGGSSAGSGLSTNVPDPSARYQNKGKSAGSDTSGNIVIPNGDGTSTVISPDGSVKTVKGVPK